VRRRTPREVASLNFGFLAKRCPELERIGARSERYFSDDPIISLMTVRRFGEVLAQLVAAGVPSRAPDAGYPPEQADLTAVGVLRGRRAH
jgi:hypothetical protein